VAHWAEQEGFKLFKLKRLELLGFKSFADRTRLEFADGIAAVVGPNGCGKSNLSDSISWVLGEQSARMLRGERMADVIFNGSGLRPPTGMAEVSLTLINPEYDGLPEGDAATPDTAEESEGELFAESPEIAESAEILATGSNGNGNGSGKAAGKSPVALLHRAGEIVVTRRLFRSGESEYLINGETCRLRDIQDLFMGTGLGPESYAIIEQGRIGQILSSKPADRRAIIEEAAGVSKFKTRKRLAEAKLESSRANLARITDILEEVTKQVNSLKRQASKARRYRELHDELRGRLKVVLTSRLRVLDGECARLRAEVAILQEQSALAAQQLEEIEREHKSTAARHEHCEGQLTQARELAAQIDLERQRLESRLEQIRQQTATLEARVAEAAGEAEQLQAQAAGLNHEAGELDLRAEAVHKEAAEAREALAQLMTRREEFAAQLSGAETSAESLREALLAAVSGAAQLRNQLVQAEEAGLALERQAARAEAEKSSAQGDDERLSSELEMFTSEHARGQTDFESLSRSHQETVRALDDARKAETWRRSEIESLRRDLAASTARKQALEESLARHSYTTESVRRLLQTPPNGHSFKPLGLLADFVEVSSGYEEVVGEFLRNDLDCVVVEGHAEARSGIALLQSQGSGRSTFFVKQVPSHGHANGGDPRLVGSAGVIARVRDLVRFEPQLGINGDFTLPALEHSYVVEDSTAAEHLATEFPDCHFLTKTGEHYHHRLVSGGKGSSTGPLAMRRDFRELEQRTVELESKVRGAESKFEETVALVGSLDEDSSRLASARQEAEKKTILSDEKLRQTRESAQRARERFEVLSSEAAAIAQELRVVLDRQAGARERLEAAHGAKSRLEEQIAGTAEAVRQLRAQVDALTQELSQAQARSSTLDERSNSVEAERVGLRTRLEEVRGRLARLAEQTLLWREEQAGMAAESESARTRMEELAARQEAVRTALREAEEESQAARLRRDELAPRIESARAELDASRERKSAAEVALARADSDHAHHAQQCRDELNAEPAQLLQELSAGNALTGEGLQVAEDELRALKTRLENLGPVNMMALEELQDAEERFSFLETQRQDLLASIEDTAQAIKEIDQISKQQFLEAFKAINENFAVSFRTLFGGGIGQMRLSDESDPDSGLDIVAQPPGKRLQNVLLLSGGEKALAALALLIAVFRFTPSPFCILDEVDAPLDESNVDRFTRMIREMSRHTQFILMTHNKRTMEIAQFLYGVTMEEPGVSKIVSVRFDEAVNEPEAVPA
jgi:chromosome segregation protein